MANVQQREAWRVREFLERFPVGKTKLYRMINRGELKVLKAGRSTLVPNAEVEAWLQRCSVEAERTFRPSAESR